MGDGRDISREAMQNYGATHHILMVASVGLAQPRWHTPRAAAAAAAIAKGERNTPGSDKMAAVE